MVRVQLLGAFSLEHAQSGRIPVEPSARPLASFLFSFPNQLHRRDRILDRFWRNRSEKMARASLSKASWLIRQRLSSCATYGIRLRANQNELWLEIPDQKIVDAHCFRDTASQALSSKLEAIDLRALDLALGLYKGPFLEEYDEDWVLDQRELFQSLYLRSLTVLMSHYSQRRRIEDAISYGRRILDCDPTRETIQRALMVLYVLNSQRAEAIRHFERCRQTLREECDVDPAPETCSLFRLIHSGAIYNNLSGLLEKEFSFSLESGSLPSW